MPTKQPRKLIIEIRRPGWIKQELKSIRLVIMPYKLSHTSVPKQHHELYELIRNDTTNYHLCSLQTAGFRAVGQKHSVKRNPYSDYHCNCCHTTSRQ
jgi:hypothetical protein